MDGPTSCDASGGGIAATRRAWLQALCLAVGAAGRGSSAVGTGRATVVNGGEKGTAGTDVTAVSSGYGAGGYGEGGYGE